MAGTLKKTVFMPNRRAATISLDSRTLPNQNRTALILEAFDRLQPGGILQLGDERDPRALRGALLVGLVAWPLLPVAALPQVDFPTISVYASLPGASPETMASSVATPLERRFGRIAGINEMTSSSTLVP